MPPTTIPSPPRTTLPITLRPAIRADLPSIARLHAAAFANFEIYDWILPYRHQYPEQFYRYLLHRNKNLFVQPDVQYYIAEAPRWAVERAVAERDGKGKGKGNEKDNGKEKDKDEVRATATRRRQDGDTRTGATHTAHTSRDADADADTMIPLGFACWEALGASALSLRWSTAQNSLSNTLERLLLPLERTYTQYFLNRVADYASFTSLRAKFGDSWADVPDHQILHLQFLITGPEYQGLGVGGKLLEWGFEVARREGLPMGLESSYAGMEFYGRKGFRAVGELVIEDWTGRGRPTTRTPLMAWEGKEREGRWLEEDGKGGWRWKKRGQAVGDEEREALEPSDVALGET